MKIEIYVEGGGSRNRDLQIKCREGFASFFRKAELAGRMPRIIAAGSRNSAFDKFCKAMMCNDHQRFIVLLVDSESPVPDNSDSVHHLKLQDHWNFPETSKPENIHLMVQCMETWFLADTRCLASYFGEGFKEKKISTNPDIEHLSKSDVLQSLKDATRNSQKGHYQKGSHSFEILKEIDPHQVSKASRHAKTLLDTLLKKALDQNSKHN